MAVFMKVSSSEAKGTAGTLAFIVLILCAAWGIKVCKSLSSRQTTKAQKVLYVIGSVLLAGLLAAVAVPLL